MRIELTRFRVREGKSARVDEWMTLLRAHLPAVLETLERERMHVETIFREVRDGRECLYWYSIQSEGAAGVDTSPHEIDRLHLELWKECIDPAFPPEDLVTEVVMIPGRVRAAFG